MPKLSFWQQLTGSVLNFDYYPIFIERPLGKAISYLILLTFIVTLLVGMQFAVAWNKSVDMIGEKLVQGPDFVFENGEFTINAPMPYIISKEDNELYIIDTSGQSNEAVLKDYTKGMFIGKNKVITKKNDLETQYYNLNEAQNFTFTKADVVKSMPLFKWLNIVIVLSMFLYSGIANLIAALFVSFCGLIASRIMNFTLGFNELYKIGIYVLTLPLFLELLGDLTNIKVLHFQVIFYLVAIVNVVRVMQYLKAKDTEEKLEI